MTEMRNVWYFRRAKHNDDDLKKINDIKPLKWPSQTHRESKLCR